MTEEGIHPAAVIEDGAVIGKNVTVEAYAVIKAGVTLEDGVVVKSHAYIDGNTTIGQGTYIFPSVVIGTKTQDLKFTGESTYVRIGKNCEIREFTTINSSCGEGSSVEVGDNCLIMACCHVAHQCKVGNDVIMSNNAVLAGHVTVEDNVIIGGMSAVHQFTQIGCHAMVGGMSRVTHDVLPYTIGGGIPFKLGGLNLIGLKRRGFSLQVRTALSRCYRLIYRSGLCLNDALARIEGELEPIPEVLHLLEFCKRSKRGPICQEGVRRENEKAQEAESKKELIQVS